MTDKTYCDGLRRAEEIAVHVTDEHWNSEFARHGNKGLATMKTNVGHEIEAAIHAEWKKAKRVTGQPVKIEET